MQKPFHSKHFVMESGINWYVVREALDDVHVAMNNHQIVNIRFDWVKYRINWVLSGPGYYAAINVTKQGKWSPIVCKSASPQ